VCVAVLARSGMTSLARFASNGKKAQNSTGTTSVEGKAVTLQRQETWTRGSGSSFVTPAWRPGSSASSSIDRGTPPPPRSNVMGKLFRRQQAAKRDFDIAGRSTDHCPALQELVSRPPQARAGSRPALSVPRTPRLDFFDRALNRGRQLLRNFVHPVRALRVRCALLHYLFHSLAGCLKIAIDTYIATANRFCHPGIISYRSRNTRDLSRSPTT
jgi:hypothetical protein